MADYYAILTNTGKQKLAAAQAAGETITLTEFAVGDGDGDYVAPLAEWSALENEVWRGDINRVYQSASDESIFVAEGFIDEDTGGWYVREMAVFDADGDMIGVANNPETYKAEASEGAARDLYLRMLYRYENAGDDVEFEVDPSQILATQAYVDAHTAQTGDTHGVPAGEDIEWQSQAQGRADSAEAAANSHAEDEADAAYADAVSDGEAYTDAHAAQTGDTHGVPAGEDIEWQSQAQGRAETEADAAYADAVSDSEAYTDNAIASHTHGAGDITSGTMSFARLPFSSGDRDNWNTGYSRSPTGLSFSGSGNGSATVTINRQGQSNLSDSTNLSHSHTAGDITTGTLSFARLPFSSGDRDNWNTAYSRSPTGLSVSGGGNSSINVQVQRQGSNLSASTSTSHNHDGRYLRSGVDGQLDGSLTLQGGDLSVHNGYAHLHLDRAQGDGETEGMIAIRMTGLNGNDSQVTGVFRFDPGYPQLGDANTDGRFEFLQSVVVEGELSKGAGAFDIKHPDPAQPEGTRLRHSFVESPTAGDNLYRFEVEVDASHEALIPLPGYWWHLNENPQVWVSGAGHLGRGAGHVDAAQDAIVVITDAAGIYNVLCVATRCDAIATAAWARTGVEYFREPKVDEEDSVAGGGEGE